VKISLSFAKKLTNVLYSSRDNREKESHLSLLLTVSENKSKAHYRHRQLLKQKKTKL